MSVFSISESVIQDKAVMAPAKLVKRHRSLPMGSTVGCRSRLSDLSCRVSCEDVETGSVAVYAAWLVTWNAIK